MNSLGFDLPYLLLSALVVLFLFAILLCMFRVANERFLTEPFCWSRDLPALGFSVSVSLVFLWVLILWPTHYGLGYFLSGNNEKIDARLSAECWTPDISSVLGESGELIFWMGHAYLRSGGDGAFVPVWSLGESEQDRSSEWINFADGRVQFHYSQHGDAKGLDLMTERYERACRRIGGAVKAINETARAKAASADEWRKYE